MEAGANAQTFCTVDNLSHVGHIPDQLSVCVPVAVYVWKVERQIHAWKVERQIHVWKVERQIYRLMSFNHQSTAYLRKTQVHKNNTSQK